MVINIRRQYGSAGQVRVYYTTSSGSALAAPADNALFVATSGWLMFEDGGQGVQTLSVSVMDNGLLEGPKTFYVNLTQIELVQPRYVTV